MNVKHLLFGLALLVTIPGGGDKGSAAVLELNRAGVVVMDTSAGMRRKQEQAATVLERAARHSFDGFLRDADRVEVWEVSDRVHLLTSRKWAGSGKDEFVLSLETLARTRRYSGRADFAGLMSQLSEYARVHERVGAMIVTDGAGMFAGTPFDREINEVLNRHRRAFDQERRLFVISLLFDVGRCAGWAVTPGDELFSLSTLARTILTETDPRANEVEEPEPEHILDEDAVPISAPVEASTPGQVDEPRVLDESFAPAAVKSAPGTNLISDVASVEPNDSARTTAVEEIAPDPITTASSIAETTPTNAIENVVFEPAPDEPANVEHPPPPVQIDTEPPPPENFPLAGAPAQRGLEQEREQEREQPPAEGARAAGGLSSPDSRRETPRQTLFLIGGLGLLCGAGAWMFAGFRRRKQGEQSVITQSIERSGGGGEAG